MLPMTQTLKALNDYVDGGLFRDAVFPNNIDRDLAIAVILANNWEYEPLYKDAEYMQQMTTVWAAKWQQAFERWALALSEDYDPLHNYDRHELVEESHDDATTNGMKTNTKTKDVNTNKRSSFDSSTYEPHDQNTLDGSGDTTSDATGTDKGTFKREAHLYGNIGVTTSAQMLEGEIEVRKMNLYNMIADCYATELCLLIY